MSAFCEVHPMFEKMVLYFEARHVDKLGSDGDVELRQLISTWGDIQCDGECPKSGACPFTSSSTAVAYYGYRNYFELFAALTHTDLDKPIDQIPERKSADLLKLSHNRQPGHFGG